MPYRWDFVKSGAPANQILTSRVTWLWFPIKNELNSIYQIPHFFVTNAENPNHLRTLVDMGRKQASKNVIPLLISKIIDFVRSGMTHGEVSLFYNVPKKTIKTIASTGSRSSAISNVRGGLPNTEVDKEVDLIGWIKFCALWQKFRSSKFCHSIVLYTEPVNYCTYTQE